MIVNCREITDTLQLKPIAREIIVETHRRIDSKIWVDLQVTETGATLHFYLPIVVNNY